MDKCKTDVVTIECLVDGELTDVTVAYESFQAIGMQNPAWKPVEVHCGRNERFMCDLDRCPAWDSLG